MKLPARAKKNRPKKQAATESEKEVRLALNPAFD
jgi:hypothetical protein